MPHFFTKSSAEGHLGCFQLLAITNKAVISIALVVYGISFGYMPRYMLGLEVELLPVF